MSGLVRRSLCVLALLAVALGAVVPAGPAQKAAVPAEIAGLAHDGGHDAGPSLAPECSRCADCTDGSAGAGMVMPAACVAACTGLAAVLTAAVPDRPAAAAMIVAPGSESEPPGSARHPEPRPPKSFSLA